jgi:phenylalanyl-tRNA synthetase beta chain
MKISLKWLQDFVDVQEFLTKPEALAEALTRAGLEVEEIQNKGKDFNFVVTGLILEKDKHPNADKLSLCKVTTGEGVVHQIVCGAQNHKKDDKVIVALPGAVLPGNFSIKQSVIRSVESGGMLCSYKELGMPSQGDGIVILPTDAPLGKPLAEYFGLDDVTFELKVTPNRADCLSHFGLAREISCLLGKPLKTVKPEPKLVTQSSQDRISLNILANDLCPRYTGRYLTGVKVGDSPDWLKKRLEVVGLNSINNIVDCTNYVMLELGQPLHAFDADQLQGAKVIVDRAQAGERFITLDGSELTLKGEELMIKDGSRSVCIAGVIGGKNSGVSENTKNIFLESAYFTPMSARKSARTHGLNTDSGYRFSRGVDPSNSLLALDRATELILKVAGGEAFSGAHDIYPSPIKKTPIEISLQTITDRMGYEAQSAKFEDFFSRLGCNTEKMKEGRYQVLPPTFRFDLDHEMDLVEEYARLYGYEHIPESIPALKIGPTPSDQGFVLRQQVSEVLRASGFSEAMNYALISSARQKQFLGNLENLSKCGLATSVDAVRLVNPLNEDFDVLRQSLALSLYQNLQVNFSYGNDFGRTFEIGKTFCKNASGEFQEHWRLGIMMWGQLPTAFDKEIRTPLVYELRATLEALLQSFRIQSFAFSAFENRGEIPSYLHRGQASRLKVEGKEVGYLGTVHPLLLEESKIRVPAVIAELDLDQLLKGQPRVFRTESISKFQKVERDLALVMPKALAVGDVIREIKKAAGPLLKQVAVFDYFEGEKLGPGLKSVAFRLIYQDQNATLQDQPVADSIGLVLKAMEEKFKIAVR